MADITVVKRDGSQQPFDANKINLTLLAASEGLPGQIAKVAQIAAELQLTLFDGITTEYHKKMQHQLKNHQRQWKNRQPHHKR